MSLISNNDGFRGKGAVEQETPEQKGNVDFEGQLAHRHKPPMMETLDTDFPEPGESPEHTGELVARQDEPNPEEGVDEPSGNRDKDKVDQDPGERQKRNQGGDKEDPLAA